MANPISVPLPADLPTNWARDQIVAPNGEDAGYEERYGYNYLMEAVNRAQTAAKECGEALDGSVSARVLISYNKGVR